MSLVRCPNGHVYNAKRYGKICPYCSMKLQVMAGKNFVGRADDMDIQILGDNEINRKNHTIIVYDAKKMNTMILPGDSSGIAYLNDEPVYVPMELKAYDTVSMGNSRFLFVPLCGMTFSWEDMK